MPAEFDSCVRQVTAQLKKDKPGIKPEEARSRAFAICTAQFKKAGKAFQSADNNIKESEKKIDEDGNIIVAENVKVVLTADVNIVEE